MSQTKQLGHVSTDKVSIKNVGAQANITIMGEIDWWENCAAWFKHQIDQAVKAGAKDLYLYLNTPGGDMIETNEIINQLDKFIGNKVCELGALCASCGTQISSAFPRVIASKNTLYMVHEPMTRPLIQSPNDFDTNKNLYMTLRQNAIEVYVKKTGLPEAEIAGMMSKTTWMSAKEALEKGFVDEVKDTDAALPVDVAKIKNYTKIIPDVLNLNIQQQDTNPQITKMKELAKTLGLPEDATEADFVGKVAALKAQEAAIANRAIANLATVAEAKGLDKESIEKLAKADFEATEKMVTHFAKPQNNGPGEQTPENKPADTGRLADLLESFKNSANTPPSNSRKEWSLEDWERKDPAGLKNMMQTNAGEYCRLFNAATGKSITANDVQELAKLV